MYHSRTSSSRRPIPIPSDMRVSSSRRSYSRTSSSRTSSSSRNHRPTANPHDRTPPFTNQRASSSRSSKASKSQTSLVMVAPSRNRPSPEYRPAKWFDIDARLDNLDKNRLRIKTDERHNYDSSDIPPWLDNPTENALRVIINRDINTIRTFHGLNTLSVQPDLNRLAALHNYDQAYILKVGAVSHIGSDDMMLEESLNSINYEHRYAGENLARGPDTVREVLEYFMDKFECRSNILHPCVSDMGLHVGRDVYGNWFWTLIFCG